MSTTMSGLRVYVNSPHPTDVGATAADDVAVNTVFYSRRGNGPIYRWLFEEKLSHWRVARMDASNFDTHKLANASWKSLPPTLQRQLGSHYLD